MNIESARKASDPANPDQGRYYSIYNNLMIIPKKKKKKIPDQQPARKSNEVDYETAIEATGRILVP